MLQHQRRNLPAITVHPILRVDERMNAFIREYERQGGNISITCLNTGVSRQSYYRWMTGTARVHKRFQRKIAKVKPKRILLDSAHAVVMNKLNDNDLTAAIFTLRTQGRHEGWNEKLETLEVPNELLTKVAKGYMLWHDANPNATTEEKMRWLGAFAARANLPPAELEAAVEDLKEKG